MAKLPAPAVVVEFPLRNIPGFEEFVRRNHAELLRYLQSRLANPQDAADLAQECYARLLRYREGYPEPELKLLLFRVANNLLTDTWRLVRTHKLESHVPAGSLPLVDPAQPPVDALNAQQRLARLKTVIERLPPKCQAVFLFSRLDGLSHAEIARKCGISLKAVEKHITRALAACRRADEDAGGGSAQ